MSLDLSLLPDGGVRWLDASGQHSDVVLSTRVRLARNVDGYAFASRARDWERLRVLAQAREALRAISAMPESFLVRVDELGPSDRALLFERHLVSKELAGLEGQHPLRSGAAVYRGSRSSCRLPRLSMPEMCGKVRPNRFGGEICVPRPVLVCD